jgi:hypothetical protein
LIIVTSSSSELSSNDESKLQNDSLLDHFSAILSLPGLPSTIPYRVVVGLWGPTRWIYPGSWWTSHSRHFLAGNTGISRHNQIAFSSARFQDHIKSCAYALIVYST